MEALNDSSESGSGVTVLWPHGDGILKRNRFAGAIRRSSMAIQPLLANSNLSNVYFPTRGFAHSLLIHAIVIGGVLLVRPDLLDRPHPPEKAPIADEKDFQNVIWLPLLQSGPS